MACPDIEEIDLWLQGELTDKKVSARLDRHVKTCSDCQLIATELRENSSLADLMRTNEDVMDLEARERKNAPELPEGYEFVALVRKGGQATVCKAIQESTGRVVALKILSEDREAGSASRMEREFELISRLQHPHIVRLYDSGYVRGQRFLAMEFIEGRHLDIWLEDEALPLSSRVSLIAKICGAVHHAHQRGVIHRDLKPSNILIDEHGDPHVLDFGIAKPNLEFAELRLRDLTKTGEFAGTIPYSSPEQLSGNPDEVDVRTDVHALGLLLFEAVALRHAFREYTSIADLIRAITDIAPPALRSVSSDADADLESIANCALDKDPDRRYASAQAMQRDLERWRDGDPVEARGAAPGYLLRKIVAKHRLLVVAASLIFITLIASTIVCSNFWLRARREAHEADRARLETARERDAAKQRLHEREQLSDILKLRSLIDEQKLLWPVGPPLVARCELWLRKAKALKDNEAQHQQALRGLRARALPYSDAEKREGYGEDYDRLLALEEELAATEPVEGRSEKEASRDQLRLMISGRLYWSYKDPDDAWFELQLSQLIDLLVNLDEQIDSVKSRLHRSRNYLARSVETPAKIWEECRLDLAQDERFIDFDLEPIPGLVPLGKGGPAKLWSFWHIDTGDRPLRDEEKDRWSLSNESGMVLILVPGGNFMMGEQNLSEEFDADSNAPLVTEVKLSPFFISQYEMTLGQWSRFVLRDSQRLPDLSVDETLPFDGVSWKVASRIVTCLGLSLPTEAQWEYACRAGTDTIFPWGNSISDLEGMANVLDAGSCANLMDSSQAIPTEGLDDGFQWTAPVGTFLPNGFGLYDIVGNVAEWCEDDYLPYDVEPRPADGLRVWKQSVGPWRVWRGGAYVLAAELGRCSYRRFGEQTDTLQGLGIRAVLNFPTSPGKTTPK